MDMTISQRESTSRYRSIVKMRFLYGMIAGFAVMFLTAILVYSYQNDGVSRNVVKSSLIAGAVGGFLGLIFGSLV